MTRDEMLKKLHSIKPGVELTILPSEGALECEYVSKNGCTYEWIGMYDWPIARLSNIFPDYLEAIQKKLQAGTLTFGDIDGTPIHALIDKYLSDYSDEDDKNYTDAGVLKSLLGSLKNITLSVDGELYAIFDSYATHPCFEFFADYETMCVYFCEDYKGANCSWEDMSDDDLEQWLERLEDEFQGVPFYDIGTEDAE